MKFSLIFCTLGRDTEVELFFRSLTNQSYSNYEIIIVDQNQDDRVLKIYNNYKNLFSESQYIRSEKKGLSLNRNKAIKHACGQILAFPDDDCIYRADTLNNALNIFQQNPLIDVISGTSSPDNKSLTNDILFDPKNLTKLNFNNAFGNAISYTLFFKNLDGVAGSLEFDELLGVGSIYGSTEETSFLFDFINCGKLAARNKTLTIFHPNKDDGFTDISRIINYSLGVGAFAYKYKNISYYLLLRLLVLGPSFRILKCLLFFNRQKLLWNFLMIKNRWKGFILYRKEHKAKSI
jgi:glycosyltransferase involved in cell wall biosynthesis